MMKVILVSLILAQVASAIASQPGYPEGQSGEHRWRRCVHYLFKHPGDSTDVLEREILLSADNRAIYHLSPGKLKDGSFFLNPSGATFNYWGTARTKGDTLILDLKFTLSRYSFKKKMDPIEGWKLVDSGIFLVDVRNRDPFRAEFVDHARQVTLDIGAFLGSKGKPFVPASDLLKDLIEDPVSFKAAVKPMMTYYLDWRDWLGRGDATLDSSQAKVIRDLKRQAYDAIKPLGDEDDKPHFWNRLKHALMAAM